jgi:amidohydrolase
MKESMSLKERILRKAGSLMPELVEIRRHIHRHPELAYAEHETAGYISRRLDIMGIEHRTGIAGTGIVGFIRGESQGSGLMVGLRADIDALPVAEAHGAPYRSINEGIMHACGHDAHVAMLLGTAHILNGMRSEFAGTVLLVFQPGEEKAPGGAKLMIESGIFDSFEPDLLIAQHVIPELPTGMIGFHAGPYMASCDEIYITVAGKGGHAARPSEYTDQIYIASELVIALKDTINEISKNQAPAVFGIGRIEGLGATNVIPATVNIACTFRTFDEKWRNQAKQIIRDTAADVASGKGVDIKVNIVEGYPVLVNNEALTLKATELTASLIGKERTCDMPVRMSSEDFSFFAEKYPSFMFRLGITREGEKIRQAHTSEFDIDESAMTTGTAVMSWLALNFMVPEQG